MATARKAQSAAKAGRKARIFVLNGPNLNLLGLREPEIYGRTTLTEVQATCERVGESQGIVVDFRQSNHEGLLIDWIHEAREAADGLILNAGAYTHTSIAIHDALKALEQPKIELHISNIHAREEFRRHSYVGMASDGVICGFGIEGYALALDAMKRLIEKRAQP